MGKDIIARLSGAVIILGIIGYLGIYPVVEIQIRQKEASEAHERTATTTTTTTTSTLSVMEKNAARKESIKKYCDGIRETRPLNETMQSWRNKEVHSRPRLYFSDTMKLVLCETPKCGTTQWRNLMLIFDGHLKNYKVAPDVDYWPLAWKHNFMWGKLNLSKKEDREMAENKFTNFYKIMTTREPLERLVSAFRDKLENGINPSYRSTSVMIHKKANKGDTKGYAKFEEFVDFILSTKSRDILDPHWKPYSELCDPCSIDYDFIARMETVYEDAEYITRQIGISRDRIYNSTGHDGVQAKRQFLYHKYFDDIPPAKRQAIFTYYKDQYDMFGYEYPTFINMSQATTTESGNGG